MRPRLEVNDVFTTILGEAAEIVGKQQARRTGEHWVGRLQPGARRWARSGAAGCAAGQRARAAVREHPASRPARPARRYQAGVCHRRGPGRKRSGGSRRIGQATPGHHCRGATPRIRSRTGSSYPVTPIRRTTRSTSRPRCRQNAWALISSRNSSISALLAGPQHQDGQVPGNRQIPTDAAGRADWLRFRRAGTQRLMRMHQKRGEGREFRHLPRFDPEPLKLTRHLGRGVTERPVERREFRVVVSECQDRRA